MLYASENIVCVPNVVLVVNMDKPNLKEKRNIISFISDFLWTFFYELGTPLKYHIKIKKKKNRQPGIGIYPVRCDAMRCVTLRFRQFSSKSFDFTTINMHIIPVFVSLFVIMYHAPCMEWYPLMPFLLLRYNMLNRFIIYHK